MSSFSNDVDILKIEPALFGELHFPWLVEAAGTGATLAGTQLTTNETDFLALGVTPGQVIYLKSQSGSPDGAYEIVSVDAPTQLTVSVLRANPTEVPVPPPSGTDVEWRISTFASRAEAVAEELAVYFGIGSDCDLESVMNTEVLRQASTLAVISSIYTTWANHAPDDIFWIKSRHYKQEFEKARLRCSISIDTNGDGVADLTRTGSSIRMVRV
jgi:hypothetical protein